MIRDWQPFPFLKVYIALALAGAAALSPAALSFIPVLLLAGYLYLWRWPLPPIVHLLTEYFIFFAIALVFSARAGDVPAALIALPVLLVVHSRLAETASSATYQEIKGTRQPTDTYIALGSISVLVMLAALLLSHLALLLVSAAGITYLGALGIFIFRKLPGQPVQEFQLQQRILAGTKGSVNIELTVKTGLGGLLFVKSPYQWLEVIPDRMPLRGSKLTIGISLTPDLSGPSIVTLQGQATDRWGLFRINFEMKPLQLFVVPRAKYAQWLAAKYIAGSKPGALPLVSNVAALKPVYGLRRGVEYYGSRPYQPGDSMKNIDWKHSVKHNELISKEFAEFQGHSAIVLINLTAGNAEEADRLAYNIIVTALSLAQDNIPAALAAYDQKDVRLSTGLLSGQRLAPEALQLAREITTVVNPKRYLNPPDILRLKANISRLRTGENQSSLARLAELLQLEYEAISTNARHHPATQALAEVMAKADKQANVVIISHRNHDAEALALHTFELTRRGNAVIAI